MAILSNAINAILYRSLLIFNKTNLKDPLSGNNNIKVELKLKGLGDPTQSDFNTNPKLMYKLNIP